MTKELNLPAGITTPEENELTSLQRDQLTAQFAELVADNMDIKDLVRYAIDGMIEYFNEGSLDELREEIDTFDEELYEQLVDNVTSETITQGGQS